MRLGQGILETKSINQKKTCTKRETVGKASQRKSRKVLKSKEGAISKRNKSCQLENKTERGCSFHSMKIRTIGKSRKLRRKRKEVSNLFMRVHWEREVGQMPSQFDHESYLFFKTMMSHHYQEFWSFEFCLKSFSTQ